MSNPRTILFVDHAPALGGAEHSLLMILEHLDRQQWQPHLVCAGGPLAQAAATLEVPVHLVSMPRLRRSWRAPLDGWTGIQDLVQVAHHTHATVVLANTVRAAWYAAFAARLANLPFIWYRRDFWLGEAEPRHRWLDSVGKSIICALSACMVANSAATARQHPCPNKIRIVYNGIDTAHYVSYPTHDHYFRATYQIPDDHLLIGMIGRLRPIKGQARFLHVLAQVRAVLPEVYGVVVGGALFGDDGYATQLHQLATDLGLHDHVIFTDHIEDPRPALAAMDVFVQPGEPEAFGLVNIEAMAMEKPVVAFAHGALPEIVVDGVTGILVESNHEQALADAVVELLRNESRRLDMGRAGRQRVESEFHIDKAVRNLEQVLAVVSHQ